MLNASADRVREAYQPWIDGLRGLAILLVVGYHLRIPGFEAGFVGVDIFFVVSGYLITGLLVAELEQEGRVDLWAFYARRVRRLFPAFLATLIATLGVGWVLLSSIGGERADLTSSAIYALLISANHYFFANTGGYFDGLTELKPLLHTWSLSVEEQFYLAWPVAVALTARFVPATGRLRALLIIAALTWLASTICCIGFAENHQKATFFLAPARAWELAVGVLVKLVTVRRRPGTRASLVACLLGISALGWTLLQVSSETLWPGAIAQVPVLGTGLLIWGCAGDTGLMPQRLLSTSLLVRIGLVSYSWYLWHWPLLAFGRVLRLGEANLTADLGLALLALGLACLSYAFIENPIRRRRFLGQLSSRRVVGSAAALTMSVLAGIGVYRWSGFDAPRSERERQLTSAQLDRPKAISDCQRAWNSPFALPPIDRCTFPNSGDRGGTLLLWGDSHAMHWLPMLLTLAERERLSVLVMTMDSCPPLPGYEPRTNGRKHDATCLQFNEAVATRITALAERGELRGVVLGAAWSTYAAQSRSSGSAHEAIARALARIDAAGVRALIIGPVPSMPYPVPACLYRRAGAECAITRSAFEEQRRRVIAELAAATAASPNSRWWDPSSSLCDEYRCAAETDSVVLYSDRTHVTATASARMAPAAMPSVAWLVRGDSAARTGVSEPRRQSMGTNEFGVADSDLSAMRASISGPMIE